jgi:hypothetical protein
MSRSGWPLITTPITALPLTELTVSAPAVNQSLVYNGTIFVNQTITGTPLYFRLYQTASANAIVNNTNVSFASSNGPIVLSVGKYIYMFTGRVSTSTAAVAQIRLNQTAGLGTFTTVGAGFSSYFTNTLASTVFTVPASGTLCATTNVTNTQECSGQGEITVSTNTVSLVFSGFSASSTTITLAQNSSIQFVKVL